MTCWGKSHQRLSRLESLNSRKSEESGAHRGSDRFFIYAKLGRFRLGNRYLFGSGLGNTLFPWARSEIASERYSLSILAPVWCRLTSGGGWITALKAFGSEKHTLRTYDGIFKEGTDLGSTGKNLLTLAYAAHLDENALPDFIETRKRYLRPVVFVFRDVRDRFASLADHQALIAARFSSALAERAKEPLASTRSPRFACHVRLGDFNPASELNPITGHNARLPIEWYVALIKKVSARWPNLPIDLFSDGTDAELSELLRLPTVCRAGYGNAATDLLAMSRASLLICSGSTYSAWAAFLGQMPTIWFPGKQHSQLGRVNLPSAVEMTGNEPIPESFRCAVKANM
jgi:hypothetical protein